MSREEFFRNLSEEIKKLEGKKVLVVTDLDDDGFASGILLKIILEKLNCKHKVIFRPTLHDNKILIKKLEKIKFKEYDYLIFVDCPFSDDIIIAISKLVPVIYIDHHKRGVPKNIPESLKYFDYRAYNLSPIISCTQIVYKIGKILFSDFKKFSYIAAFGAIGDWMLKNDEELISDLKEVYPSFILDNNILSSPFIELYVYFRSLPKFDKIYNLICENSCEEPYSFLKNVILKFEREISRNLSNSINVLKYLEKVYEDSNVIVFFSKKTDISISKASTILSSMYKKVILVGKPQIDSTWDYIKLLLGKIEKVRISARNNCGKNIDLGKLFSEFSQKYGIRGGGHPPAAGLVTYFKNMKKLIEEIRKSIH